jgi:hypothetical protein
VRVLALLLVSILLVSIVFAPEEEETTKREDVPPEQTEQFWKSSNNLKSATPDQVSAGLSQGVIGPEQLKQLSADQLRPNLGLLKDDQIKGLSRDQISSIGVNNFAPNQLKSLKADQFSQSIFNDLDSSKRTSVQPTVRNEIYSQASGVNVEVSKKATSEDAVVYQDGFEIRTPVDAIKVDDAFVTNGQGIQFRSGVLKVDKADSSLIKDGHLILLEKLEKTGKTIKVDRADEVKVGCVRDHTDL